LSNQAGSRITIVSHPHESTHSQSHEHRRLVHWVYLPYMFLTTIACGAGDYFGVQTGLDGTIRVLFIVFVVVFVCLLIFQLFRISQILDPRLYPVGVANDRIFTRSLRNYVIGLIFLANAALLSEILVWAKLQSQMVVVYEVFAVLIVVSRIGLALYECYLQHHITLSQTVLLQRSDHLHSSVISTVQEPVHDDSLNEALSIGGDDHHSLPAHRRTVSGLGTRPHAPPPVPARARSATTIRLEDLQEPEEVPGYHQQLEAPLPSFSRQPLVHDLAIPPSTLELYRASP